MIVRFECLVFKVYIIKVFGMVYLNEKCGCGWIYGYG